MRSFTTTPANRDPDSPDIVPFMLDGVQCHARRPKSSILLDFAGLADGVDVQADGSAKLKPGSNPFALVTKMTDLLNAILMPLTRAHIAARVADPEDDLDLLSPQFLEFFTGLMEDVGLGPTKPSSGSQSPPDSPGAPSTETSPQAVLM